MNTAFYRLALLVCLPLFAGLLLQGSNPLAGWASYSNADAAVKALLPGPSELVREEPIYGGELGWARIASQEGLHAQLVYEEFALANESLTEMNRILSQYLAQKDRLMHSALTLKHKGHLMRQFRLVVQGMHVHSRHLLVGNRYYGLELRATDGFLAPEEVSRIFEAFVVEVEDAGQQAAATAY